MITFYQQISNICTPTTYLSSINPVYWIFILYIGLIIIIMVVKIYQDIFSYILGLSYKRQI